MIKPIILTESNFAEVDLEKLRQTQKIWQTVDIYSGQLEELAEIVHPADKQAQKKYVESKAKGNMAGIWVYYPWSGVLLHCVGEEELFILRTNRNQNLITSAEQRKLANSTVAVAGMSVGSGIALASVYSGISNSIKLADFDVLETANLNRLRESLADIRKPKVTIAAEHIYELNPFADIHMFTEGLDGNNIDNFFENPKTDIVVDEIDDFKMKIQLRLKAKQYKIPIIMFTSLGDNILVDIERYDIDSELLIFNGEIGNIPAEILQKDDLSADDIKRYAVQLVGQEYVPTKAMASLLDIGKSLVGRPQLFSTVAVDGGLAAFLIKSIIRGNRITSGRYFIKFSELFGLDPVDLENNAGRQDIIRKLVSHG